MPQGFFQELRQLIALIQSIKIQQQSKIYDQFNQCIEKLRQIERILNRQCGKNKKVDFYMQLRNLAQSLSAIDKKHISQSMREKSNGQNKSMSKMQNNKIQNLNQIIYKIKNVIDEIEDQNSNTQNAFQNNVVNQDFNQHQTKPLTKQSKGSTAQGPFIVSQINPDYPSNQHQTKPLTKQSKGSTAQGPFIVSQINPDYPSNQHQTKPLTKQSKSSTAQGPFIVSQINPDYPSNQHQTKPLTKQSKGSTAKGPFIVSQINPDYPSNQHQTKPLTKQSKGSTAKGPFIVSQINPDYPSNQHQTKLYIHLQNKLKKPSLDSNSKFNPVIIIAKPKQHQPCFSYLPSSKSKNSVKPKNPLRQWFQAEIISYAIFIAKLKESLQYTNSFHSLRLYKWMLDYIQNTISSIHTQKMTIKELQDYHIFNISKYGSSGLTISRLKSSLVIDDQSFEKQLNKFDSDFPQIQAVLDYYSLNTKTQNYQINCKIAQNFLNQFIARQLQSKKKPKAQEWTRYQYLTYVTFFIIKEESSQKIKKEDFYDLAEYSFGQNFGLVWARHKKIVHQSKHLIEHLVKQWKFTNQVIGNQKGKLEEFLKEKNLQKQQNHLNPSLFELFLRERKMTKLKNQLKIITDNFQLISSSLECFDFYQQHSNDYKSRRKSQKKKTHSVYLRARFQINQFQKTQLDLLKEKLMQLRQTILDEEENSNQNKNQGISLNYSEEKNDRMELEQGSAKSFSSSNFEQRYKDEFDDQNDFNKGRKMNQIEYNFEKNAQSPPQIWPSQLQQDNAICEQKLKYYQHQDQGQSFLGHQKQFDSLEKFNSSFQSTEASFGFANYSKNPDHSNKIKEQLSSQVNQLPQISQEESNMRQSEKEHQDHDSESEFQKSQEASNSRQQKIQAFTTKEFIQNLVSQEQYTILQPIFERKTLQHRLMVMVSNKKKKMNLKKDARELHWHFSENVKFVSFLITTKFAFTNGVQQHHTFGVMSEFVRSRNPAQCCDHYQKHFCYATEKLNIDQSIEKLIDKFQIPKMNLYKEVNRQKQHYLQTKGKSIFQVKKQQHIQGGQTEKLKKNMDLIVENLEKKCLEFNITEEYLTFKPQYFQEQSTKQEISEVEKERYLNCLESFYIKNISLSRKRLMQFADEIFKERGVEQRQQLLERYHRTMMNKHKQVGVILLREKTRKQKKTYTRRKNNKQVEQLNNIRFSKYFCEQIDNQKNASYMEIEILKYIVEWLRETTEEADQFQIAQQ